MTESAKFEEFFSVLRRHSGNPV